MELQIAILKFSENIRSEFLTQIMTVITMTAEGLFIVAILAGLYWCIDKKVATKLSWCVLFSLVGNGIIKNIVRMPRPFQIGVVDPIRVETATSYSFPSGHTQSATSFWTGAMLNLKTKGVYVIGTMFIVLTAVSRVYLGVHWPMDVIGGIIFGIILTIVASKLIDNEGTMTYKHVLGTSVALLVVLCINVDEDLYKITAALWGMTIGVYIEQKHINFIPYQIKRIQIKKVIVGCIGLIVIYMGISTLFPESTVGIMIKYIDIIKYALILFWITAGAPYVFKKITN